MIRIAVFASGNGTNTERIMEYFNSSNAIMVGLVLSNRPSAYVLERAKRHNIETYVFNRKQFYETGEIQDILFKHHIQFIVLAGFLWLIPSYLVRAYTGRIVNIHPALLPKYGGKGMYGNHVHQAVKDAGDDESGISVHYVNENFDEGQVVFQAKCKVARSDSPADIAQKVHQLEYEYYPRIIEQEIGKITCS